MIFFHKFSQSLAIYFELFSFGKIIYSESAVAPRVPTAASLAPDSRLDRLPTASRTPPSPRPLTSLAPPSQPPWSEVIDARVRRRLVPLAARPSPSRRATVSAPVIRHSLPWFRPSGTRLNFIIF
jgi:hypothetical protein